MRRQEIQLFAKEPDGGWSAIDFGSKTISIAPEIGKTGHRMIHMHPTLIDWLRWLEKKGKPPFLAPNFNKGLRAIKAAVFPAGTDGAANIRTLEPNLPRHSFISYSLRLPGASFAEVAMNAGNTEAMIKEHYNSLQSTQEQALEYWGLTPKRILKAARTR